MRKLLLMSLIVVPVLLPILFSSDPDAQRGRKRTVWSMVIFVLAWALVVSQVYFRFPAGD